MNEGSHIGTFCGDGSYTVPLHQIMPLGEWVVVVFYTTRSSESVHFSLKFSERITSQKIFRKRDSAINGPAYAIKSHNMVHRLLYFYTYKHVHITKFEHYIENKYVSISSVIKCYAGCDGEVDNKITMGSDELCEHQCIHDNCSCSLQCETPRALTIIPLGSDWPFLSVSVKLEFVDRRNRLELTCRHEPVTHGNNMLLLSPVLHPTHILSPPLPPNITSTSLQ